MYRQNLRFVALLIYLFGSIMSFAQPKYYGGENGKKLDWTLFYIKTHYVDSTDNERLTVLAIERIFQELDPYSIYQSKEELDRQKEDDSGAVNDGLGIRYYIINDTATITFIEEAGPAREAGLRRGDRILSVDSIHTVGENFDTISQRIKVVRGTKVSFLIFRKHVGIKEINITSTTIPVPSVETAYMIDTKLGYIKINRFTLKTLNEFVEALTNLKKEGLKDLILDLRDNRGGVVKGATNLADEFLKSGDLIMYSDGKGFPRSDFFSTHQGHFEKGKLVILVNEYTASASEIFTAAIQEWDRGIVVGQPTFGKGLIQQSYLLGDSSAVRLTIGRYYTPTNRTLQRPYNYDKNKDLTVQQLKQLSPSGFTKELKLPDSLIWKTKSDRTIIKGQGGIIPDIYIATKEASSPILEKLNELGLVYRFTVYYADKNRIKLKKRFKSSDVFRRDQSFNKELAIAFAIFMDQYKQQKDIVFNLTKENIPATIIQQIKAWMAPQVWDVDAYYAIFNAHDPVLIRAIEAIKDRTFEKLGIEKN